MLDRRQVLQGFLGAGAVLATGASATTDREVALPSGLHTLSDELDGKLLTPSSAGYDNARQTFSFNPRTNHHPAAIVQALSADDIARAIEFARARSLPIAVRAGGHDVLAMSTVDSGLVIDLRLLRALRNSGESRVRVGPGVLCGGLNQFLAPQGRAVALGCNDLPSVGGMALGGGLGWFVASRGASCDALVGATLVSADGRTIEVSRDRNPELLWALRGGGGNFGVVSEFEFETFPMREVSGGMLVFDGSALADFLRFFARFMADRPEELVIELLVHGIERRFIVANICYAGDADAARKALRPLYDFATPLADGMATVSYPRVMDARNGVNRVFRSDAPRPAQANDGPGIHWLGGVVPALTDEVIERVVARIEAADFDWAFNLGHNFYGAVCRSPAAESPLLRPEGSFTFHFDSWWSAAARAETQMRWVDDSLRAMAPLMGPDYINYMSTNEPAAVRRAYGENFSRLRTIKRRYDPDNVFQRNRNLS